MTATMRKEMVKSLENEFNFSLMPGFMFYETRESRRPKRKTTKINEITNPVWFVKGNDVIDGSEEAIR
jgi:hypothetical protein